MIVSLCDIIFIYEKQISQRIRSTKICSSFKLFRSCPLWMLIRTSSNRIQSFCLTSQWSSLECHVWNEVRDFGIVGRPFAVVVLFPMVPMWDVLQQKKYLVRADSFRDGLNRKHHFDVLLDKLGIDVAL